MSVAAFIACHPTGERPGVFGQSLMVFLRCELPAQFVEDFTRSPEWRRCLL